MLTGPANKEDVGEDDGEVTKEESTGGSASESYDRPDIQFSATEACRGMSKPGEGELQRMRRLARYLKGARAATVVGSSWAGCVGSEINGLTRTGKAAAHRGEAVVGAGSGSTKAVPHHQDSWRHKPRGHPDKAEVHRRHSGSSGWCWRFDRLGEVTRRKFCPVQLCALVSVGLTCRSCSLIVSCC